MSDVLLREVIAALEAWRPFHAVVVGDFMLDELVLGDAERLSADAPVPVLRVRERRHTPGGAANLALDLAAMDASVSVVGVVGDDGPGRILRKILDDAGIDTAGLLVDPSRPTTTKRNFVGLAQQRHPQKMFRLDEESRDAPPLELCAQLEAVYLKALQQTDVVCIEDYDKGVCFEALSKFVIDRGCAAGIEVLVDPASIDNYARYRGATAITPNRNEAERATGLRTSQTAEVGHNVRLAHALQEALGCQAVALTLDRHGALLLEGKLEPLAVPTVAREVYDVTGAGDMFLAGFAAGRAQGLSWAASTRLANIAAGLEVEIFGVEPIPLDRILVAARREAGQIDGVVLTLDQAAEHARLAQLAGRKVVFTNGCFDVLHAGHIALLEKARALGDELIVGLNTDDSVRRLKGESRPVNTEHDRACVLGALRAVDAVVFFDDDTPLALIEAIGPDVLVKGADYAGREVVGREAVEARGGRVELIDLVPGRSTTATIERMASGR